MKKAILVAAFMLLASVANAQFRGISAKDLNSICAWQGKPQTRKQLAAASFCLGYLEGWATGVDGAAIIRRNGIGLVLVSEDADPVSMRGAFLQYMKKHPEAAANDADSTVAKAMYDSDLLIVVPLTPRDEQDGKQKAPTAQGPPKPAGGM